MQANFIKLRPQVPDTWNQTHKCLLRYKPVAASYSQELLQFQLRKKNWGGGAERHSTFTENDMEKTMHGTNTRPPAVISQEGFCSKSNKVQTLSIQELHPNRYFNSYTGKTFTPTDISMATNISSHSQATWLQRFKSSMMSQSC